MIFFKDGSPAYITRRFDVKTDGTNGAKRILPRWPEKVGKQEG